MKRVAIVSFHHDNEEASGGMRSRALERHLPQHGWEPLIVTLPSPGAGGPAMQADRIAPHAPRADRMARWSAWTPWAGRHRSQRGDEPFARRAWRWLTLEALAVPDADRFHVPELAKAVHKEFTRQGIDAVISTSGPPSAHLLAQRIKRDHGVPWIADFRDLWTKNPYYRHWVGRRVIERRMEGSVLREADAVTATSRRFAESLAAEARGPVLPIYTGVPEHRPTMARRGREEPFTLVHAGALYGGRRDPEVFLHALSALTAHGEVDRDQVRLEFIGDIEPWLAKKVQAHGVADMVTFTGRLPHAACLDRLAVADALLLLGWNDARDLGSIPYKLFEYAALGRPILMHGFPPDAETTEVAGRITQVTQVHDQEEAVVAIRQAMEAEPAVLRGARGALGGQGRDLTQAAMVGAFARLLDQVTRA